MNAPSPVPAAAEAASQVIRSEEVELLPWVPFRGLPDVSVRELWRTGEGVAGLLRFSPGAREVTHVHHSGYHHLWLLEGRAEVNGTEFGPGSYAHTGPGVEHSVRAGGAGCLFFFVYVRSR